jgi:hypothetical protein
MKKKKLKKQLSKTEKKLARAKAEIKDLRAENNGAADNRAAPELKVMAAQ